ncbi:hypothetical protein KEM48_012355 [Puccinia striiformis f. sp. tritici PST-130]|nr:hypothetical protein KEM48_012355 [Puccinia striiformis f. sp. tritici PST-130]
MGPLNQTMELRTQLSVEIFRQWEEGNTTFIQIFFENVHYKLIKTVSKAIMTIHDWMKEA